MDASSHPSLTYLKSHFELEDSILDQILLLEDEYKNHYELHTKELKKQEFWVNRMVILTERLHKVENSDIYCEYLSHEFANLPNELIREYGIKLGNLRSSICRLMVSIHNLKKTCLKFEELCSRLDMSVQSPLITGDEFHKPLGYFMEFLPNLFKYFHARTLKLKCCAHLLDPEEFECLGNYMELVKRNDDFEHYFRKGMVYCNCFSREKLQCK
ncbi:uncharacterized protein LOC119688511 [Teleopsis dalmanni]|uniref:uncharacterized protein LOC119688511 n=1 Tax=Teleopsis dalmanni TaxID=139649 RepID=UPI0018CE282A|nr:uncharacterized protein LOC119688511 [Teleopsis dalmanni]XP_037959116.1 uncharacterized protein LOC119688511 [Teleopsis dalmanni]